MSQEQPRQDRNLDSLDPRTELSADRTMFAAERTYAAWVRTGLAALASGVGAQKLLDGVASPEMIAVAGTLLVLFSAFCFGAAVWRQLHPGLPRVHAESPRIPRVILIVVNAGLVFVALAALIGLWMER